MRKALRLAAFGLLFAALSSCSMFDYSNMVVHKYALVYGVTRYTLGAGPNAGPNLTYPDADAASVYAQLKAWHYTVSSRWIDGVGNVWLNNVNQNLKIGSLVNTDPTN
ncbi:MAG TPA: hypothetical protein VMF68_11785, partial [Spirochaetia bacterium]|nr:hypothetical protein [Spirochaetia bacterium]